MIHRPINHGRQRDWTFLADVGFVDSGQNPGAIEHKLNPERLLPPLPLQRGASGPDLLPGGNAIDHALHVQTQGLVIAHEGLATALGK